MRLLTASSWWLAQRCTHPWTGPHEWPERKPTWATRLGNAAHTALELIAKGEDHAAAVSKACSTGLTPRQRQIVWSMAATGQAVLGVAKQDGGHVQVEKALAINPEDGSVKVLAPEYHRDYRGVPPGWFAGTLDVAEFDRDGHLTAVRDWKTGLSSEPWKSKAVSQVALLTLMASKAYSHKGEVKSLVSYLRADGDHYQVADAHGEFTLPALEAEVKRVGLAYKAKRGPQPGEHCGTCPIKERCEEYNVKNHT